MHVPFGWPARQHQEDTGFRYRSTQSLPSSAGKMQACRAQAAKAQPSPVLSVALAARGGVAIRLHTNVKCL